MSFLKKAFDVVKKVAKPVLQIGGAALGFMGAREQAQSQEKANEQNYAMQKEFAQHGIRWKAEDSRAAGIHPLFGLGAQTIQPSPAYVGADPGGAGLSSAGQSAIGAASQLAVIEGQKLQNKALEAQIYRNTTEGLLADMQAAEVKSRINRENQPSAAEGTKENPYTLYNWYRDLDGSLVVLPHTDLGEIGENALGKYFTGRGWSKEGYGASGLPFSK